MGRTKPGAELADEAFWTLVNQRGAVPKDSPGLGRCWLWRGPVNGKGKPVYHVGRRARIPHRYAWQCTNGDLPPVDLGSLCWHPLCVRPSHRAPGVVWRARLRRCKDGHPLAEGHPNTHIRKDGKRQCRKCAARRVRESCERRRLALAGVA